MKKYLKPKYFFNTAVIGLCIGIILYFFFSENGLRDLLRSDTPIIWEWIVVALVSEVVFMLFESSVIYVFITDDYPHFRFIDAVKVALMGLFWCAVTPSSTGGQPMQVYLLYSMKIPVGYSSSRLIQKFMVYQVVLTTINMVSVFLNIGTIMSQKNIKLIVVLLALGFITQIGVTVMFLIFSFSEKLARKLVMFFAKILNKIRIVKNVDEKISNIEKQLESFHTSNRDIYKKPKLLTKAAILTFCQFIAMFLVSYFIYRALGFNEAGPVQIISSQAIVNLVCGMFPVPGASGAAELSFTVFYSPFFIHGTLKSAALIWRFINYYAVVVFTAPFAYFSKDKTKEAKLAEEQMKNENAQTVNAE